MTNEGTEMDETYDSTREAAEAAARPHEYVVPVGTVDFGDRIRPASWAHGVTAIGIEREGEFVKVLWEVGERLAPEAYTVFHKDEWVLSNFPSMDGRRDAGQAHGT
jgi:hypothetical protein